MWILKWMEVETRLEFIQAQSGTEHRVGPTGRCTSFLHFTFLRAGGRAGTSNGTFLLGLHDAQYIISTIRVLQPPIVVPATGPCAGSNSAAIDPFNKLHAQQIVQVEAAVIGEDSSGTWRWGRLKGTSTSTSHSPCCGHRCGSRRGAWRCRCSRGPGTTHNVINVSGKCLRKWSFAPRNCSQSNLILTSQRPLGIKRLEQLAL